VTESPAEEPAAKGAAEQDAFWSAPSLGLSALSRVRLDELLTEQERRILEHIAQGLTNHEIAQKMFLADKTVKNYVSSVLAKLGLERRTQAAVLATKLLGEHRTR